MLESPLPSPTWSPPSRPTGARRLTLDMRARLDQADRFTGLQRGTAKPWRFLAAFQEAEPYLGLPAHAYKLVAWLVKQTRDVDWEEGSRPICWPSARRQQEFLCLSPGRVKHINRALFEAGIFVIRDNEQGKRYGRRDAQDRIIEAYGFDLSPLAQRYDEFVRIAAEAKVERDRMRKLRRKATLARRAITQAGDELAAQAATPPEWPRLAQEVAELAAGIRQARRSDELALAVAALERRQGEAEQWVRQLIKSVDSDPVGLENKPHQYTTTTLTDESKDTVIAQRESSRAVARPQLHNPSPSEAERLFPQRLGFPAVQLVELAPRLERYVPRDGREITWPVIVEAAWYLTADLGISKTLWAHACHEMGRDYAALAVALVSTRPAEHFTSSAGGYFAGMVKKFEKGELHLDRTLWRLRDQKWGDSSRRHRVRH